ncbi:MAG TPA: pyridoxamine 5'-phosphate oxidase family protein [Rhizobiaceae bacterium]|nr:pyridoxamine 5'-phosphate oxidase family protein [Rhizobiaceae bacterium]
MWVRSLSHVECTRLLDRNRLAHLACTNEGRPYVVPIYYASADNHLYAFSLPGKKIEWMRANPFVSLIVEERSDGREWRSVVVDGRYEEIPDRLGMTTVRDRAWSLLSKHPHWWEPGALKPETPSVADRSPHLFFRIHIDEVSGREARDQPVFR